MHITDKTEFRVNGSSKVVENEFLGRIVGGSGAKIAYNIKTGETYEDITLYQQIYDENGNLLSQPIVGDNDDYYLGQKDYGEKIKLVDYFKKIRDQEEEQKSKVPLDKKE